MADQQFAFEPNGPMRLRIQTEGSRYRFFVDEALINDVPANELRRGFSSHLADGSVLSVAVRFGAFSVAAGWMLERDGVPLPGSGGHRTTQVQRLANVYFGLAGLSALYFLLNPASLFSLGATATYAVVGWVGRRGAWGAFAAGFAFYLVESAIWFSERLSVWGVLLRGLGVIWLFNSVRAIRKSAGPSAQA